MLFWLVVWFHLFFAAVSEIGGVRSAELVITPRHAKRGSNVTMTCIYRPWDSAIHSVKWYKGNEVFLHYSPFHDGELHFAPVRGIKLHEALTNSTHVKLLDVDPSSSGNYTCGITILPLLSPNIFAWNRLEVTGSGVRALELLILPEIVQRGSDAILECVYELYQAPLYSVKWYRGRHEFYRYSPSENPSTKIFPFAGINVDLSRSNESQVVLTKVSFGLSGNFSCEVTADAPSFATSIVSNQMEVVVLPQWAPRLRTAKVFYNPGDLLQANCSSPPSRPQADLLFYLNESPIHPGQLRVQQTIDGLRWAELSIAIQLLPMHYDRGSPTLRCEALIRDIYREVSEVVLYSSNSDPKIERVTFPGSSGSVNYTNIIPQLILLLFSHLYWMS